MRILVVGDGKVGHVLAEHLTREGHNVVIVDIDEEALQRSEDTQSIGLWAGGDRCRVRP